MLFKFTLIQFSFNTKTACMFPICYCLQFQFKNQNQKPTSWIKCRKQLVKQNNWSLWSDKYFFWSCSHFLLGRLISEDLSNSLSQTQPKIKTKRIKWSSIIKPALCPFSVLEILQVAPLAGRGAGSENVSSKAKPGQSDMKEAWTGQPGDPALQGENHCSFSC